MILQYSMYGHIAKLAEAEKKGIEEAGGSVDVYQCVMNTICPQEAFPDTSPHAGSRRPCPRRFWARCTLLLRARISLSSPRTF